MGSEPREVELLAQLQHQNRVMRRELHDAGVTIDKLCTQVRVQQNMAISMML